MSQLNLYDGDVGNNDDDGDDEDSDDDEDKGDDDEKRMRITVNDRFLNYLNF